jgi:protein SCO1
MLFLLTTLKVKQVAKAYRVYYSKHENSVDPSNYLVDHSIITYLVDPEGNFVEFYSKSVGVDDLVMRITNQVLKFKKTIK